jgi:hypothetical protein
MTSLRPLIAIAGVALSCVAWAGKPPVEKGKDKEKDKGTPVKVTVIKPDEPRGERHSFFGFRVPDFGSSSWSFTKAPRTPPPYTKLDPSKRLHIEKVLAQKTRPTIAEFTAMMQAAYGGLPKENPFGKSKGVKGEGDTVAKMIAQLELAYPGGTWLPLGRDAVLIADLLDAYYRSIGQPGRVKRLDASGTSFPHYRDANEKTFEEDRDIITGFLKSNGLDLDHPEKHPPFVMIDVTSYSRTSQSTQLMRSAYRTWAASGRDPKLLFDHVNFVGVPQGWASLKIEDAAGNIDVAKSFLKSKTTKDGPDDILYLSTRDFTYTTAWHEMFRRFEPNVKGGVSTEPGSPLGEEDREEVLSELYETMSLVGNSKFHSLVKDVAARKYGYEFPSKRTTTLARVALPPGAKALPTFDPKDYRRSSFGGGFSFGVGSVSTTSTFVKGVRRELGAKATAEKAIEFLKDLAGMKTRKSMFEFEVKDALKEIHSLVNLNDAAIQKAVEDLEKDNPGFQDMVKKVAAKPPKPRVETHDEPPGPRRFGLDEDYGSWD